MKRILTILALTVFVQSFSQAQMKQGSVLIGGDINFYSQKTDGAIPETTLPKNSGFSFSPSAALALHDNFYAGVSLNYGHSSTDDFINGIGTSNQKTDQFGGAVFLREYKPLGSRFYFFVEEDLGAGGSKTTTNNISTPGTPQTVNKTFALYVSVYPGVAYSVTAHFQLETGLQNCFSANYGRTTYDGGGKQDIFNVATAFNQPFDNLYLGARFLFGQ